MTKESALELADRLEQLADHDPGADDTARAELRKIKCSFEQSRLGAYVNEKMTELAGNLDPWLSATKWHRDGRDPDRLKAFINADLSKLRQAIESWFHPPVFTK